jgi:hypothetical protein
MRIFLLILVLLSTQLLAVSQQQCNSLQYQQELIRRTPELASKIASIETFTRNLLLKRALQKDTNSATKELSVIRVPVVVHVLYHSSSQNISDAQIQSEIDVLNRDYQRLNADTVKTPSFFRASAADCGFQFQLAQVDPHGNPTTGIVRKSTTILNFNINDDIKSTASGGDDAWDCDNYLNIWVGSLSSGILGYSSVPGCPKEKDGVVIQYTAFGTMGSAASPFNGGRTTTHEIGHWLNLIHTWGDADCGDDKVADTPPQEGPTRGCPGTAKISCGNGPNGDMYMNFMDFTDDACMNMFTNGQRERMHSLFAPGGPRYPLLSSTAITSISAMPLAGGQSEPNENNLRVHIYPNPASDIVFVQLFNGSGNMPTVEIYNEMGQKVMTTRLNQHLQQLDISSLKPGIYYIKTDDGSTRNVAKLVKM